MKYKLLRLTLMSLLMMLCGSAFADEVTMKYSGSTTTNMTGENDAELLGLDATEWNVIADKGAASNMPGLNKAGNIRLYWNTDGGNTITVQNLSGKTISSIAITYAGSNNNAYVTVDGNTVKGEDGVYAINGRAFVIGNANTSNVQVHITQIVINYGDASDTRIATNISLGDHATTGNVGASLSLPSAALVAGNGNVITDATLTWSSSDETVASINTEENTISLLAAGTTTIKVEYAGNDTYKSSSASYELTVASEPEDYNYAYEFTEPVFTAKKETKALGAVDWSLEVTCDDADGYFGFDQNNVKGQQFGSAKKAVKALKLFTTGITGKIEKILVNTSGAASIEATLTVTVGESGFVCNEKNSVSLTSDATDYVFTGNASGLVVLTFEQTSSKAIYIKSIKIKYEDKEEPQPIGFRDIKADLTQLQDLATESDVYVKVAEDGSIIQADNAEEAAATLKGKWHGTAYGWSNFEASVPVPGCVKITYATHDYGNDIVVTNEAGAEVAKLNTQGEKWSSNHDNVVVAYYRTNEATTLHFSKANYNPYFAVEAIDPADLPAEVTKYNITFAKGDATGEAPAAIEVNAGEKFSIPANKCLYKEGFTLTGWTDGGNTYKAGVEIEPVADMALTPVFTANTVTLADRTDRIAIDFELEGYNDKPKYNFNGNSGIMVTQVTIGEAIIDVKAEVDATNGKFAYNGSGWHQVNAGTKVTVPSCKGATIIVETYNDATSVDFNGAAGTVDGIAAVYTVESEDATLTINQNANNHWNKLSIFMPKPEQGEEPQPESGEIYSWDAGAEKGGKAEASNGTDVGAANGPYEKVIIVSGKNDFSTNTVTITLDNELKAGDKIFITGYRNKNAADKQTGALLKFDKGGSVSTYVTGLEFVNIDTSDDSAEDSNRGTEPNTIELTVPDAADGSTVITMTRAKTQTNLFITKLVITGERGGSVEPDPEPQPDVLKEDLTATWDFTNAEVVAAVTALSNTTEAGTVKAVEDNGLLLTVEANGLTIRDNGNSIQTGDGVVFKVPVQSNKDIVTVVGFAEPYFAYSVGGIDATEATTVYTAKVADVAQGYVEVVNKGQYLISIKVEQKSQLMEKQLYSTDFSDWTAAGAKSSESTVAQQTKYSKETLNFTLYNTAVMNVTDTKFANYTELPHMALQAQKAADPYIKTSKLASVTKVRFIHGATGNSRGWKLEAMGDGDSDWVVISEAYADPSAWCEVIADVNRTNCQLRWTNLNSSQNAYMFELDIYGKVDMGNTPMLGTFKANGVEYVAGDIFSEQTDGTMAATIEISKSEPMISETNSLTDITADNGEIGTLSYRGDATECTVIIPVTLGESTLNYVAHFIQKADFTLTYYNTDGTIMGTQSVEKDAAIGEFAYDFNAATAGEGQKVRGWFVAADGGRKFTTSDIITANTSLYAVQTPIEVQSPSDRYTFNLAEQYFYAEDHEAFEPVGKGEFHDTTHGWVFGNGDKVNLLVGGNANIVLYLCNYSAENAITLTNAEGGEIAKIENAKVTPDGAIQMLKYTGEAGTVTLNFNGTCYVHKMIIANQAQPLYAYNADTKTYTVNAGKAVGFLGALDEANGTGNVTIYLPNGIYDLGNECLTTISGENITIEGESQEETIIQNLPKAEGIGVTATLLNTSNYLTLKNLTLKNAYPYYNPATGKAAANAGRAVCLQDKGNYTVCRNVTMLSYQDTYYSNNSNGQFYFVDCDIHGLVDFVCGGGDVFYEKTTFTLESREMTEGKGDVTIAAPNGAKQFGYVMNECTVDCKSATFNWGRSWGSISGLAWLNTTLKQPSKIVSSRFTAAGMNSAADAFYEYNTMDESGNVISPRSNVIKFTHSSGNKEYETILSKEQADRYAKIVVFADAPQEFKDRVGVTEILTSIKSTNVVNPAERTIYNMKGMRVQKAEKGLYIINGKKVVIK